MQIQSEPKKGWFLFPKLGEIGPINVNYPWDVPPRVPLVGFIFWGPPPPPCFDCNSTQILKWLRFPEISFPPFPAAINFSPPKFLTLRGPSPPFVGHEPPAPCFLKAQMGVRSEHFWKVFLFSILFFLRNQSTLTQNTTPNLVLYLVTFNFQALPIYFGGVIIPIWLLE